MNLAESIAKLIDQHVVKHPETTVNQVRQALRHVDNTVVNAMLRGHKNRTLH